MKDLLSVLARGLVDEPEHVRVARRTGVVLVRDAGSKTGTTIGDQPVPTDRDLVWKPPATLRGKELAKYFEVQYAQTRSVLVDLGLAK